MKTKSLLSPIPNLQMEMFSPYRNVCVSSWVWLSYIYIYGSLPYSLFSTFFFLNFSKNTMIDKIWLVVKTLAFLHLMYNKYDFQFDLF